MQNYTNYQIPQQYQSYNIPLQNAQIPNGITQPQGISPNAVAINIYSPQAYGNSPAQSNVPYFYGPQTNTVYPYMPPQYNQNNTPAAPVKPQYNMVTNEEALKNNSIDNNNNNKEEEAIENNKDTKKKEKEKKITPLTDEYVKNLENYLNNDNSKVRLIAAKELNERFKEDENRKDNPCLMPLLNKCLQDKNSAVRFLGLLTLQLGYANGDDKTVEILKDIQKSNKDGFGQDAIAATEILLKMSAPEAQKVKEVNEK